MKFHITVVHPYDNAEFLIDKLEHLRVDDAQILRIQDALPLTGRGPRMAAAFKVWDNVLVREHIEGTVR